MSKFSGCFTALITPFYRAPFNKGGIDVDWKGFHQLLEFQIQQGVSGIVAAGTTGESPTLTWEEYKGTVDQVCKITACHCLGIVGTGSNSTEKTLKATEYANICGADAALLVDPYYNCPSSLEIRREYVAPVAKAFPRMPIIPYVIPGRTGTQLLPVDIALLHDEYPNVCAVKEATGDLVNMIITRELCGEDFDILSGDDDKTLDMMRHYIIGASGVISVVSNVAPAAVQNFVRAMLDKNFNEAARLENALKPLFSIVTVTTKELTKHGHVACKARNPLAIKALMNILGMPSGPCRPPLGRLTRKALYVVLEAARIVQDDNPEIFAPIAQFFKVDIDQRLSQDWSHLCYDSY